MVYNYIRIVVIKMKKILKITTILAIIMIMLTQISFVYADDTWSKQGSTFFNPKRQANAINTTQIEDKAQSIVFVIRNIGIVLAVISLMFIGIKEMTASVEEKSKIKQSLPVYILGVIMVVAITCLPSLIYTLTKSLKV